MEYSDYPLEAWSLRKARMVEFCPRCAVLHYKFARMGADAEAALPEWRYLHALRSRLNKDAYLRRLLRKVLRSLFLLDESENIMPSAEELYETMRRRFDREFSAMLSGIPESDHSKPMLLELFAPECRPAELAQEIREELRSVSENISRSIVALLRTVPAHNKRFLPQVMPVYINELCCYMSPLFVFEKDGSLWFIEEGNKDERAVLLHKFYALNTWNRDPVKVRSFALNMYDGSFDEAGLFLDVSQTLRDIGSDCERWNDLLKISLEDIPEKRENCSVCKFREFCRAGS